MMIRGNLPKVYLAARYSRRDELRGYAAQLKELGLAEAPCRWLTTEHDWDGTQGSGDELAVAQRFALEDIEDLERSHAVVVFTEEPRGPKLRQAILEQLQDHNDTHSDNERIADELVATLGRDRGGRHVEFGMAVAAGKHVVVVGPAECVFHSLPSIPRYATWADALAHLVKWRDAVEQAALRRRLQA